jgi:predicted aspartyl protease
MSDIVTSQEYERRAYNPPMPVLDVGVGLPDADAPVAIVEMIVDTGADITALPRALLLRIGAPYFDRGFLRGVTGKREPVNLYLVTLHIGLLRIAGVTVVALDGPDNAILGRDALNQLDLALHGPAEVLEVLK